MSPLVLLSVFNVNEAVAICQAAYVGINPLKLATFGSVLVLNFCRTATKKNVSPEVFSVIEVPCRGMTHHLPPIWFFQHGLVPELFRHRYQTQRSEKLVRFVEHFEGVPFLCGKSTRVVVKMWVRVLYVYIFIDLSVMSFST